MIIKITLYLVYFSTKRDQNLCSIENWSKLEGIIGPRSAIGRAPDS